MVKMLASPILDWNLPILGGNIKGPQTQIGWSVKQFINSYIIINTCVSKRRMCLGEEMLSTT